MRRQIALALIFTAIGMAAQAKEPIVAVNWRYAVVQPGGESKMTEPPADYMRLLTGCGIDTSPKNRGVVEISKLECPGVIDFTQSSGFQSRLLKLIDSLIASGIKSIGETEIKTLRDRLGTISFAVSNYAIFESVLDSPGTPRQMAINIATKKLVIVNRPRWKLFADSDYADLFLFHELLGALDQRDENYQITLAAWWMRLHPERIAPLSQKMSALIKLQPKPIKVAGVSIVGHGGDSTQLLFKASLLDASTRKLEISDSKQSFKAPKLVDIESTIITAPVSSMPVSFLKQYNLCKPPANVEHIEWEIAQFAKKQNPGEQMRLPAIGDRYCAGFALKGATGKPFMLIPLEWGIYPRDYQRLPLVYKVYGEVIRELVCASGQVKCEGH